ncbi:MAG: hypothetical protein F6K36_28880 [Symploca sp. SIO3C6]|nr:hypothetical protein [Symploca sp. SIO3C6]
MQKLEKKIKQEELKVQKQQGIHVVFLKGVKQIVNLTDDRWWTLSFFPTSVQKYYLLSG